MRRCRIRMGLRGDQREAVCGKEPWVEVDVQVGMALATSAMLLTALAGSEDGTRRGSRCILVQGPNSVGLHTEPPWPPCLSPQLYRTHLSYVLPPHDDQDMLHKYQGRKLSQKLILIISLVWESGSALTELTRLSLKNRWWQVLRRYDKLSWSGLQLSWTWKTSLKAPGPLAEWENLNIYSFQTACAEYLLWARHFYRCFMPNHVRKALGTAVKEYIIQ